MSKSAEPLRIIDFDPKLNRRTFSSDNSAIDTWFREQAGQAQRNNTSRIYLALNLREEIVGFYSIGIFEDEPNELSRHRYPVRGILIQRMGVDSRFHGTGIGKLLLQDALARCSRAIEIVGGSWIAVDPKSAAADFYLNFGFSRLAQDSPRLYLSARQLEEKLASVHTRYIQKEEN